MKCSKRAVIISILLDIQVGSGVPTNLSCSQYLIVGGDS